MRRHPVLLALLACCGTASAADFLCRDEAGLATWKASLGAKARRTLERDELYRNLVATHEVQLRKAAEGDPRSRHQIGRTWAICQLAHGSLSTEQLQRTVDYLRTGAEPEGRQTLTQLGLFSAMGWGMPQSYELAYRQVEAAQRNTTLARRADLETFVAEAGLRSATPEQQRAAYAFDVLMGELVMLRPTHAWSKVVTGRGRFEDGIPVVVTVASCPMRAEPVQDGLPTAVDRAALSGYFQALAEGVPATGLPCSDDAGNPFQRAYETTLFPPDPDPLG